MKKYFIILLLVLGASLSYAQQLEWAKSFGGSESDEINAITTDELGNVYTTGFIYGTVDFDPGPGVTDLGPFGNADDDHAFVSKLDENGDFVWAVGFPSTSYTYGRDIEIDEHGNLYITGIYVDTLDVDPGIDTFNLISSSNQAEIFIVKLNNDGEFIWGKSIGGMGSDQSSGININSNGEVLISGYFRETVDFDPDPANTSYLTSNGNADAFVLKLNENGEFIWAKSFGGDFYDEATSITSDADGNVFITGFYLEVADFDPGPGEFNLTSNGVHDFFILKLSTDGNLFWAKSIGGTGYDKGYSIAADNLDNIYVCGYFSNTIDILSGASTLTMNSNGADDAIILKYHTSGSFIWAKSFGSTNTDGGRSVTVDPLNNPIVTGFYQNTMDLDPSDGIHEVTSQGGMDIFLIGLNPSGTFQWGTTFGGTNDEDIKSINSDDHGNILTSGYFRGTANFDFPSSTLNLLSNGGDDVFIQKISPEYASIDQEEITEFKLYPNPTNGQVNIDLSQFTEEVTITIFDSYGKLIYKEFVSQNNSEIAVDLNFPTGVYIVNLSTSSQQLQQKLIKH